MSHPAALYLFYNTTFFRFHSSPCVEFPVYLQGSFVTAMSTGVVGQHRQTWPSSRAHDSSRCLFSWSHSPAELLSHCTKRVVFICSWYRQTAGMCSTRGIHPHFAILWRNKPNYAFPSWTSLQLIMHWCAGQLVTVGIFTFSIWCSIVGYGMH